MSDPITQLTPLRSSLLLKGGGGMSIMTYEALLILIALLLNACVSVPYRLTPTTHVQSQEVSDPPLSQVVTRNLGDTVVSKGTRTTGEALTITATVQFGVDETQMGSWMQCVPTATPQTVYKNADYVGPRGTSPCFGPITFLRTEEDGDQNPLTCTGFFFTAYVCQDRAANFFIPRGTKNYDLLRDKDHVSVSATVITSKPNFVQELLYNGRAGDTVKFVYREFSNEMIRPAFTQDVQYDLSQSSEVGFKI
jgi:hypothetical protein